MSSDEIYEKLIYEGEHISIASLNGDLKERTIVVNGLSKGFAMTGWRIGYSAANDKITNIMANIQSHATSNANTIAQYAAICALTGKQDFLEEMRAEFFERKNLMVKLINDLPGVSCSNPKGAFYIMMNIKGLIGKEIKRTYIDSSLTFSDLVLNELNVAVIPARGSIRSA